MDQNQQPAAVQPAQQPAGLTELDIFTILGVSGTDEEKNAFLQEMQEVIWDDVISTELDDNLSDSEMDRIDAIIADTATSIDDKHNQLYAFLTEKIPNLTEVLTAKVNQFKLDLLDDRIEGMTEFYTTNNNADALAKIATAQGLRNDENFKDAVSALNSL